MLFNSTSFAFFLPIVFIIYWLLQNKPIKYQNILLLISSYVFYACWDWRFLFLLIFSTLLDYFSGIEIEKSNSEKTKKKWFLFSVIINLGFLGLFKYFNFFADSFAITINKLGFEINSFTLKVVLPIGISFYTFHGLSYIIDVYKNRIKAEKKIIDYSLFVSFFPLLVAGPIERATHLLPQIKKRRMFSYNGSVDGLRQILWGLFKKIVVADQCAQYADNIFNNYGNYSSMGLIIGAVLFSIQIYCDFSGYSDIALGTARLFGINLLKNFAFPYFSRDIAEFWRRWHISLSSWFKDYLYIPLGGNKGNIYKKIRNIFIIFLISGFWHGGNWTFIIWGALNALYIIPSVVLKTNRYNLEVIAKGKTFPSLKDFLSVLITFSLVTFSWIFFRAENLTHAINFISRILSNESFTTPLNIDKNLIITILTFIIIEWFEREKEFALATLGLKWKSWIRYTMYLLIIFSLFWFGKKEQQFIYFDF